MRTRGCQTQEAPAPTTADHDQQILESFLSHFKNVDSAPLSRLQKPVGGPTAEFVQLLQQQLLKASCSSVAATAQALPAPVCRHIIKEVTAILKTEPPLVELTPSASQHRVTVFGDTHGHFHDLCNMLQILGGPSTDRIFIFNGDFVDRGAWGVETLLLLLAYKWWLPNNVYLVRGNHETSYCVKHYGFRKELLAKYGTPGKLMYADLLQLFAQLPLAALVESNTLILHGGLFRVPPLTEPGQKPKYKNTRQLPKRMLSQLQTGSLDDLRSYKNKHEADKKSSKAKRQAQAEEEEWYKGGVDPDPPEHMCQLIASDILWSDPSRLPGHIENDLRGVGTRFGPDVTEAFLSANNLKLIIRSHEGPDARVKRAPDDQMPSIDTGYCVDHDTPSGKLVTLFSAPCYPMFTAPEDEPFRNKAAVLHLTAPDYATPEVQHFEALMPRPPAAVYYDVVSLSSESETEDGSGLASQDTVSSSSVGKPDTSQASPGRDTATSHQAASKHDTSKQDDSQQPTSQQAASPAVAQQDPDRSEASAAAQAVFGPIAAQGSSKRHKASCKRS